MWKELSMSAKSERPVRCLELVGRLSLLGRSAIVALALLGGATTAEACDLALVEGARTARIEYNPFAVAPTPGVLDVALENKGEAECDLRLSFTDETGIEVISAVLGGVEVRFRPRESSGVQAADVQRGVFQYPLAAGSKGIAQLDAVVVRGAVADAGEYGVNLRLVIKNVDGTELISPVPVRLVLQSTPRAQLNLAGAAGAFGEGLSVEVVDFGEAVTGATRRIFVQVRANAPSVLTIKSEHGGVMHRVEKAENATVVPYAVELAGETVDLTGLWTKEIDPPRTLAGISLPMNFILGRVNGQMSGRYEDLVTIDVSPK
ncbi:MAG: hypothetical protein ACREEY_09950 [Brevundimonas sp.]